MAKTWILVAHEAGARVFENRGPGKGLELLETPRGGGASTELCTLCRCGGSKNKPFCDGTHWHNKFIDGKN